MEEGEEAESAKGMKHKRRQVERFLVLTKENKKEK